MLFSTIGMAKDSDKNEEKPINDTGVISRGISIEMKEAYLDYAMSVITARALPDVRDGLKPVHRRILYSMAEMGLTASAKFRKSATVIGHVLGSYHPHGDVAAYDAMAKMAQDFSFRYPLVIGQGNFGSIDGDSPAAYRYTEAKMSKISADMLKDLNKNTVDFRPNYDGTKKEPVVLPSLAPNLLLNGTLGIAVGMATNIPPHNLGEVVDAVVHLIENEKATTEDLMEFVKGPDFPMGAVVYGKSDIYHAYASGRGPMLVRGEAEIVENKAGQFQIIITSIPYRVNKANVIVKIAELVQTKRIEGIKDIRDESTKDIRVVIDLKTGAHPNKILNALYKHTQLEDTFHLNMVALVDGVPQTLSLKSTLEEFISHRKEVVTRRTKFDLDKAEAREHILLGLKKALDHIDEIIKLIKASKDTPEAHANLMKKFKFSTLQAAAILDMKLQRLAGLERKKIEDELKEIQKLITELKALLASVVKIKNKVKEELLELKATHADERRTRVVAKKAKDISDEDLIPDEDSVLVFTSGGYVKRTNPDEYKKQKRGGVGVVDINTKEEDFVTSLITTTLHSDLLFFTDKGKVYGLKMYDVPEGRRATRGKSIVNFLALGADENITSILPMPKDIKKNEVSLLMVTKEGIAKKVDTTSFHDVRRSGLIAITLKGNDKLVSTSFVNKKDEVVVVTESGQSIRFKEDDIREMGRSASGVRAIKLGKGDTVISSLVVSDENKKGYVLVISANGYGKKTPLKEYKIQNRGGSGIKTGKITSKTGKLMSAKILSGEDEEIVSMSKKGQVIRLDSDEIPSLGRQTQGVRIMKLRTGDSIASLILV